MIEHAFVSARALYPNGGWDMLTPSEKTKAIYGEMRRMDAEQSALSRHRRRSHTKALDKVTSNLLG